MNDYKTSIPAFGYSHKEPLPCPFCGWGTIVDGGFLNYRCTCNACGATTKGYATWELAVEAWNRRTES